MIAALATLATWLFTLRYDFVWDDIPTIVTNQSVLDWRTLFHAFSHDFWGLHENPEVSGYWRPIPTVFYTLITVVFGKAAWAFHALNVGFHVGVVLLVSRVFWLLGLRGAGHLLATFFFALHPIHSETVSFISALPDVLSAFFGWAAIYVLLSTKTNSIGRFCFGGMLLVASFFSKESGLSFALLWAYLVFVPFKEKFQSTNVVQLTILFGILVPLYVGLHLWITSAMGVRSHWGETWWSHFATVFTLLPFEFLLTWIPFGLSPTRTFPIASGFADSYVIASVLSVIVMTLFAFRLRKKRPLAFHGFALFFIFWLPISNIFPAEGLIADRYLYLPAVGTALLVGDLLNWLPFRKTARKYAPYFLIIFFFGWGSWAVRASTIWKDENTLWSHATKVSPKSTVAWNHWGKVLLNRGELDAAEDAFAQAVKVNPGHSKAMQNLVWTKHQRGQFVEAIGLMDGLLQSQPENASAWDLKASMMMEMGRFEDAIEAGENAVRLTPKGWQYRYHLGTTYLLAKMPEKAIGMLEQALEFSPQRQEVWLNLAAAKFRVGDWRGAKVVFEKMLSIWPDHEKAKAGLVKVNQVLEVVEGVKE